MLRFFSILLFLCLSNCANAQLIRIGLFNAQKINHLKFISKSGTSFLFSDTNFIAKITPSDWIEFILDENSKMNVLLNGKPLLSIGSISILQEKNEDFAEIKVLKPSLKARLYEGDFLVESSKGYIQIVNEIDLEQYLEGVVESESGTGQKLEYYKVQAIISRTYALKYKRKHESAGFNLCDATHCQAYLHKRNGSTIIDSAVNNTRGIVMLDKKGKLFSTFFHANCGGQTCEPDVVWNEKIDGFSSFKDTFCIHTKQANWTKKIPLKDWHSFLSDKYDFPIWDSTCMEQIHSFEQIDRKAFYISPVYGIPLRDIRDAFKLKSTYFSCTKDGEFILLQGRGYGHGVGLCQEGAMNMVNFGYDYKRVLSFYYPGMFLVQQPISSFSFRK